MSDQFIVVRDSREQKFLEFTSANISDVITAKLDTGDYSIEGFEDILAIERKASVSEFYSNVTQKRFWAEMGRMREYPYKFVVFEFGVSDVETFPYGADLPPSVVKKLKVSSAYLMKCIAKIQVNYGIHVVFAGNRDNAIAIITNIMKEVYVQN